MTSTNGEGPASAVTEGRAQKIVGIGEHDAQASNFQPVDTQPLRAELIGSDTATACGIVVTGPTPALALCRRLVEIAP